MKKQYFIVDNGDQSYTMDLSGVTALIQSEASDQKEGDDKLEWTIETIWLTDEEFENLPEAN